MRPVTMAARLAPYLRYYASHRPTDDHGLQPAVLVVFDDELAAEHFVRVAREEIQRTGVTLPLEVSYRSVIARHGPLQQVPGGTCPPLFNECDRMERLYAPSGRGRSLAGPPRTGGPP